MRSLLKSILLLLSSLALCFYTYAQTSFLYTFGADTALEVIDDVIEIPGNEYVLCYENDGNFNGDGQFYGIKKIDSNGIVQVFKQFSGYSKADINQHLATSPDGHIYLLIGRRTPGVDSLHETSILMKFDTNLDTVWTKNLGIGGSQTVYDLANCMMMASDSTLIITMRLLPPHSKSHRILKVDLNGNIIWDKSYYAPNYLLFSTYRIIEDPTGGYYISSLYDGPSMKSAIFKIDENGDSVHHFIYTQKAQSTDFFIADNGDIILPKLNASQDSVVIYAVDSLFNPLWELALDTNIMFRRYIIRKADDGNIIVAFFAYSEQPIVTYKISQAGQILWRKEFKMGLDIIDLRHYLGTSNGNHMFYGLFTTAVPNPHSMFLFHANDSLELLEIKGKVVTVDGDSCNADSATRAFKNQVVKFTNSKGLTRYSVTDTNGCYSFIAFPEIYTISHNLYNPYWQPNCPNIDTLVITATDSITCKNFVYSPLIECPAPFVELGSPVLSLCRNRKFNVEYCNYGTVPLVGGYVEVDFDTTIVLPTSASIPWGNIINGTTYVFNLDTVQSLECGIFEISVSVACDTSIIGGFHCTEARIYPDTLCFVDSLWDLSSISVKGFCIDGDSVEFRVYNVGSGNMSSRTNIHVIEDDILIRQDSILLNSNDSVTYTFRANGNTFLLLADQTPYHPGNGNPFAVVYGCGGVTFWPITGVAADDFNPFVDEYCGPILAAYDPNDKTGFPLGVTEEHYISKNDNLEYFIRFQNTGTDTAHTVIIRDTISPHLDLLSILPGVSSHNYTFSINPGGVAVFTFSNIALPDSGTDEPASNGFVKYTIDLQTNLPIGTRIENTANIVFDINAPIRTNTTFHTIGEIGNTHWFLVSGIESADQQIDNIKFYPNPFTDEVFIEIESPTSYQNLKAEIYDLQGRLVGSATQGFGETKLKFNGVNYQNGLYFIHILTSNNELLGTGKILKY